MRRAELRARLPQLEAQIREVNKLLRELEPESVAHEPENFRWLEAQSRQSTRMPFAVEKAEAAIERTYNDTGGRRVVQGPKSGVTSVVQGRAPGLGRRA